MRQLCITPPTELAVSLDEAKANLRVDDNAMDALITTWLQGIIASMEHEIGQCIMQQTWQVTADGFTPAYGEYGIRRRTYADEANIRLPHPVMSVASVSYVDDAGVAQTLAPEAYEIRRDDYKSMLTPANGGRWPSTWPGSRIVITVVCGYGNTPEATPPNIRLYVLAKLVEQFDPLTRMEKDTVQSAFITRLLDRCRSYA